MCDIYDLIGYIIILFLSIWNSVKIYFGGKKVLFKIKWKSKLRVKEV